MSSELDQSVVERLEREPLAWFSTLRPDGSPHLTPVWFVFHDSTLWICSARKNQKVRNVRRDPRVSVALEGGTAPIVAEGRVTIRPYDFSPELIERFKARWLLAGVAQ